MEGELGGAEDGGSSALWELDGDVMEVWNNVRESDGEMLEIWNNMRESAAGWGGAGGVE